MESAQVRLKIYLFLQIIKNGKLIFQKRKVLISQHDKSIGFVRVRCSRFQLRVIFEVVSPVYLEWLRKKRLMKRLKHLGFLVKKRIND